MFSVMNWKLIIQFLFSPAPLSILVLMPCFPATIGFVCCSSHLTPVFQRKVSQVVKIQTKKHFFSFGGNDNIIHTDNIQSFFGVSHIYGNPTAKEVYGASAFDPEGLFGSIPTILQVQKCCYCTVTLTYRWNGSFNGELNLCILIFYSLPTVQCPEI